MQSARHSSQRPRLFAAEGVFWLVVTVFVLAAIPAKSQESVITLAMARHSQPSLGNFTTSRSHASTQPVRPPASPVLQGVGSEKSGPEIKNDFSSDLLLEKQSQPRANGLILFAHKNPAFDRSMTVQAGYEQLWNNGSILRKICPDDQEPGFACVRASFSF